MVECIKVAVVGLVDGTEADAGAGVAACLDPERHERVGITTQAKESGALRPGLFERVLQLPDVDDAAFAGALSRAVHEEGLAAVLPGSTRAAARLALLSAGAGLAGAALVVSADPGSVLTNARGSAALAEAAGLSAAPRHPAPVAHGDGLFARLYPPFLLLGAAGERRRAVDEWEAVRAREDLASRSPQVSLLQASPQEHYEVALLADALGNLVAATCVRLLADDDRARPWMVTSIENDSLLAAAARLVRAGGLTGPLHFSFLRSAGVFQLIDVRPGFPLWIEINLGGGPKLVQLALEAALGIAAATGAPALTPPNLLFSQTAEDYGLEP